MCVTGTTALYRQGSAFKVWTNLPTVQPQARRQAMSAPRPHLRPLTLFPAVSHPLPFTRVTRELTDVNELACAVAMLNSSALTH